ncbi:MAG: AAA family ATPase [Erysipelotrichaceae bacterium]
MYRKMLDRLIAWKNNENKKPLIIKGLRQVGKTYTIREFAKKQYKAVIEINFERDLEYQNLFKKTRNPDEIITYIELGNLNMQHEKKDILIFFDEIQACPDALTALKFLSETSPYDIVCSGSNLGVAIAGSTSFPVGYVETWEMFPMDFTEFLEALGVGNDSVQIIFNAFNNKIEIPTMIHDRFNEFFKSYIICGGMPEVVKTYITSNSFVETLKVQRRIVSDYKNDIVKYGSGSDKIKAQECFSSLPIQLAKENKKFQYKMVQKGYNARYYDTSLRWLQESGLVFKINRLKSIMTPLEMATELNVFKIYMADTGLLVSQFDDSMIRKIMIGDLNIAKGALYENVGAQILMSAGYKSYYYEPTTTSEIDFIIYYKGEITPIEVKGGIHTRSISFTKFVDTYESKYSFRFSLKNIGFDSSGTYYLPFYLMPFLMNRDIEVQ